MNSRSPTWIRFEISSESISQQLVEKLAMQRDRDSENERENDLLSKYVKTRKTTGSRFGKAKRDLKKCIINMGTKGL